MTDRERWRFAACLAAATVVLAGCATTPPDHGFAELDSAVRQRTGMAVTWNHGAGAGQASSDVARSILSRPLRPEGAVQVALLRNRGLQASFADIGLAEADLAQAGLLQNPVLDTSLRFPDRLYGITDVAVALSENLLNLILLPARQQVAAAQAESVRFRVAAAVLDLVADVRTAYWRLRADQAVAILLRDRVAASDAAASLAARLHQAGNISELDLAREQADAETTRVEYADALAAGASDREELNRLMGLFETTRRRGRCRTMSPPRHLTAFPTTGWRSWPSRETCTSSPCGCRLKRPHGPWASRGITDGLPTSRSVSARKRIRKDTG